MKLNIFKKIILPTFLTIFLFGLLTPFEQSWAAPKLTIKTVRTTLKTGESINISAEISELLNKVIFFTFSPSDPSEEAAFTPANTCTTSASGDPSFCSIQFKPVKTGKYSLSARTEYNGILMSDPIEITITGENIPLICTSPKIPVNERCEDKVTEESCRAVNRVLNTATNRCECASPNTEINGLCKTTAKTDTTYTPLAPLPGLEKDKPLDTLPSDSNPCPFGNYLNIIIKIIIGFAAVLAMVMIVMGGIEYMTSDLVSSKEAGKETITHAILGLLIALGAFLILNTINPQLLSACLNQLPKAEIVITADEENFAKTEQTITAVGTGYTLSANGTASAGVSDFVNKLRTNNQSLSLIKVDTKKNRAYFYTGTDWEGGVYVQVAFGRNGISEIGQAQSGDMKTPKGDTLITPDRRPGGAPPIKGQAAITRDGKYNLGAAFINIGATISGQNRGIGFHGNAVNTLTTTQGCIRMKNDDLVALAPYMKSGVRVIIE